MLMKNVIQLILPFAVQLFTLANSAPLHIPGVEETYLLAGDNLSTTITCVIFNGVNANTIRWQHNGQDIDVSDPRFQVMFSTRLRINDITGEDEGLFSCSFVSAGTRVTQNIVCIFVLGAAEFSSIKEETVALDFFVGEDAVLDTRVTYTGAGPSQMNQVVTLLQLYKENSVIYFCSDEGPRKDTPCPSIDGVTAMSEQHKYDLTLTLMNISMEDAGNYVARVEVLRPGVSSRSYIQKNCVIRVHEPIDVKVAQSGENSIHCEVGTEEIDSVALEWTNSRGETLVNDGNVQLVSSVGDKVVTLSAEFQDSKQLEGQFSCVASVALPGTSGPNRIVTAVLDIQGEPTEPIKPTTEPTVTTEILVPTGPTGGSDEFQVSIGPVSSVECSVWFDTAVSSRMEAIVRQGVAAAISEHCNCEISPSDLTIGRLTCQGEWLNFRSSLRDLQRQEQVLTAIDEWRNSESPAITVGLFSLQVNPQAIQL